MQVVDEAGFASDPARTAKPRPFLVGRCASPVEARTALTLNHGFSTFVVVVDAFGFLSSALEAHSLRFRERAHGVLDLARTSGTLAVVALDRCVCRLRNVFDRGLFNVVLVAVV